MRRKRRASQGGHWVTRHLWLLLLSLLAPLAALEMGGCIYWLFLSLMHHR